MQTRGRQRGGAEVLGWNRRLCVVRCDVSNLCCGDVCVKARWLGVPPVCQSRVSVRGVCILCVRSRDETNSITRREQNTTKNTRPQAQRNTVRPNPPGGSAERSGGRRGPRCIYRSSTSERGRGERGGGGGEQRQSSGDRGHRERDVAAGPPVMRSGITFDRNRKKVRAHTTAPLSVSSAHDEARARARTGRPARRRPDD